jgi:hypothetical protein
VYSIVIDGYDPDATGSFTLRWRPITSPPHDDFDAAQPLSGARGVHASSTLGAGNEPGERRHAGSNNGSVWFAWIAPAAGTVSFDTCASSFQTALAVYTGDSMATLTEVASDDDTCVGRARVRFETDAATAYRIAIASDEADVGGDLVLSWVVTRAPANAQWRTPRRLRGLRGALNTSNEGVVAGAPDHAAVWFRWRAPRTMGVSFDTCSGGTLDATLAVYRGRVPRGAARVDRSDAGCDSEGSRLAFFARRGVDYLISVDGSRAAWGLFRLRWAQAGPSAGTCDVPDIRGLTLARATRQLELRDCTLGRVVPLRSAIVPRGRVIAQFPLPNARLRFLGRVHVEISSG